MQPMIFGFFPTGQGQEEGVGPCFGVSLKETFQQEGCMTDSYPSDDYYEMFMEWSQLNIHELMESTFEFPEGLDEEVIINYLEVFYGFEYSPSFETFLHSLSEED